MGNCAIQQKNTYSLKKKPNKIPKHKQQYITIGTLNYSSILKSPFQFFSNDLFEIESSLSSKFKQLAPKYCLDDFYQLKKWPLGKIDKLLQNRYTPIYVKQCGISKDGLLENSLQFTEKWMESYNQCLQYLEQGALNCTEDQIDTAMIFDLLCYHTIVAHIFQIPGQEPREIDKYIDQNLTVQDTQKYRQFMETFFSKPFINEDSKINYTLNAMKKFDLDILFLQQVDHIMLKCIEKHFPDVRISQSVDQNCDSAIIINQRTFPGLVDLQYENRILLRNQTKINKKQDRKSLITLTDEQIESLNFNGKTIIQVVENFIFISSHLTSKKQAGYGMESNNQQVQKVKRILSKLKAIFSDYHIVCGFDVNSSIQPGEIIGYDIFPNKKQDYTVKKTRTYLQPQINKAQKFDEGNQARDFLFSTVQLQDSQILTIGGKDYKNIRYLPCTEHPYDHFFVKAKIKRKGEPLYTFPRTQSILIHHQQQFVMKQQQQYIHQNKKIKNKI